MKVVMLTNNAGLDKLGGLERYVGELASQLAADGREVTVVAKAREACVPFDVVGDDGVRIIRYPMPEKTSATFAARYPVATGRGVSAALEAVGEFDVLHAHFPVPALLPALTRRRFLYTLHAPVWRELLVEHQGSYVLPRPLRGLARNSLRAAERLILRRADAVVTLSDFMRNEVAALDPAARTKVSLIPGGVNTTLFAPGTRRETGDGPRLFTARRLVPRTGVQQLVEAMPTVIASFPSVQLSVAGDGLQRPAVEAAIQRLGLEDCVELLGRISEDELIGRYQQADLAVTPTQELEGFGLSTAEALACGTPCLVTPVGANPEVVSGFGDALVAGGTSPQDLAAGIIRILNHQSRGNSAGAGTRYRSAVHPRFSWESIGAQHVELYERFVSDQRASGAIA